MTKTWKLIFKKTFAFTVGIEQAISLLRLMEKLFMKLVIHNFNKCNWPSGNWLFHIILQGPIQHEVFRLEGDYYVLLFSLQIPLEESNLLNAITDENAVEQRPCLVFGIPLLDFFW